MPPVQLPQGGGAGHEHQLEQRQGAPTPSAPPGRAAHGGGRMNSRRLNAFVEALLRNRRPKKFKPDADDADAMRAAIELRASRADEARPRPEFVSDLRRELARDLSDDITPGDQLASRRVSRRRILEGVGIAAAAVTAGVILDREVLETGHSRTSSAERQLVPDKGTGRPAAGRADLPKAQGRPF